MRNGGLRGGRKSNRGRKHLWWDDECNEGKRKRKAAVIKFVKKPNRENWVGLKERENEMRELIRNKR